MTRSRPLWPCEVGAATSLQIYIKNLKIFFKKICKTENLPYICIRFRQKATSMVR